MRQEQEVKNYGKLFNATSFVIKGQNLKQKVVKDGNGCVELDTKPSDVEENVCPLVDLKSNGKCLKEDFLWSYQGLDKCY